MLLYKIIGDILTLSNIDRQFTNFPKIPIPATIWAALWPERNLRDFFGGEQWNKQNQNH